MIHRFTKRQLRKIIQEVIQESIPDSIVKRLTPISKNQRTRITGEGDITEETGPVVYFRALKTNTGEFRVATNRKEQRQGGYKFEQLPKDNKWVPAIELLTKDANFPVMEWRDIHYFPETEIIKHLRRGLPSI
jgi:hypothetical protein